MEHLLDNVVWHALSTRQSSLGRRHGSAVRFAGEVALFSGIEDPDDPKAWDDLAVLLGERPGVLFAPGITVPDGWDIVFEMPCLQMVATGVVPHRAAVPIVELGPRDVADMLALVEETQPGPMGERTVEMGRYVGVREDGKLIAMAGERFSVEGYTEVSLVCTAPQARGRGLGRAVVDAVIGGIRSRGDEAFLHVLADNSPAIALYAAMGFALRTRSVATGVVRRG